MERPIVNMWEKDYAEKHREWVYWHAERSEIDNKKDFVRWFMQYSKGRMSPQTVIEAWDEKENKKSLALKDSFIQNVHSPFYEELVRNRNVNPD